MHKAISGGQDGVDQAWVLAAWHLGIPTGGTAPKGWRTEFGPAPWLAQLGLVEHRSPAYPPRTWCNVRDAEATLIFGWAYSPGCTLTRRYIDTLRRPALVVEWPWVADYEGEVQRVAEWLRAFGVVNGAGNREATRPGIYAASYWFFRDVLARHGCARDERG